MRVRCPLSCVISVGVIVYGGTIAARKHSAVQRDHEDVAVTPAGLNRLDIANNPQKSRVNFMSLRFDKPRLGGVYAIAGDACADYEAFCGYPLAGSHSTIRTKDDSSVVILSLLSPAQMLIWFGAVYHVECVLQLQLRAQTKGRLQLTHSDEHL